MIQKILYTIIIVLLINVNVSQASIYYFETLKGIVNGDTTGSPFSGESGTSYDVSINFSSATANFTLLDNDITIDFNISGEDISSASFTVSSSNEEVLLNENISGQDSVVSGDNFLTISNFEELGTSVITLTAKIDGKIADTETMTLNVVDGFACNTSDPLSNIATDSEGYYLIGGEEGYSNWAKSQLLCLSNNQTSAVLSANYKLTANVDFDSNENNIDWNNDGTVDSSDSTGWNPIGHNVTNGDNPYIGTFNGNNHYIDHLYTNPISSVTIGAGFFGYIANAEIHNLITKNIYSESLDQAGGIVGSVYNSLIKNCYSYGEVAGYLSSGGIVGCFWGNSIIENSYSNSNVYTTGTENGDAGGIVGDSNGGTIKSCYAEGTIHSISKAGGLIGSYDGVTTIENSYAKATVSGDNIIGALVGASEGEDITITKSYAINSTLTAVGDKTFDVNNYCSVGYDAGCSAEAIQDGKSYASFDGSTGYIDIPDIIPLTSDFTISSWVNSKDVTRYQHIVQSYAYGSNGRFTNNIYDGTIQLFLGQSSGNILISTSIDNNKWYFVTAKREGNSLSLYLNGSLVDSQTMSYDVVSSNQGIGGAPDYSNAQYLYGYLDQVLIYDRALTNSEITNMYNNTSISSTGILANWDFDGDASDSSGNGNNGTTSGGVSFISEDGWDSSIWNNLGTDTPTLK